MFHQATNKRVAVFIAAGLEEIEGLTVVDCLYRAGIPCDTVSIVEDRTVVSSHEVTIVCKRSIYDEDFSFDDYSMLVLPGGIPGTPNLHACEPLCEALVRFANDPERAVAAICAAPSVLGDLGILKGRRATANPGFQQAIADAGATLVSDERAVVDGNVITSQGAGTALYFGLAIVGYLLDEAAVEHVRHGVVLI